MGIDIAFPIVQLPHKLCGSVADHKRHRFRQHVLSVFFGFLVSHVGGVGLGGHGQIDDGMA